MTFDTTTRTISGTPSEYSAGTLFLELVGTDDYGATTIASFQMAVAPPSKAPSVSVPLADRTAYLGSSFTYTFAANAFVDPDVGDTLSYTASLADGTSLPSWLMWNAATRTFSGTPTSEGVFSVSVTARDQNRLSVADVFDISVGGVQNQILTGTSGANTLTGGAGNDVISGLAGNDTLSGGAGNDTLDGGAGNDSMRGGLGNDTYVVDSLSDIVVENASEGFDTVQASVNFALGPNLESILLTGTTATTATGNSLDNQLIGNGLGNVLNGGGGIDTLTGAGGDDTYVVDNSGDVIIEQTGQGVDTVETAVSFVLPSNVEKLTLTGTSSTSATGNAMNNNLNGNAGSNLLDGGAGADTMAGGSGNDTYFVDAAGDVVTELASGGTDEVKATVNHTLGANVENLTLMGTEALSGTGNAANNVLVGNSGDNVLDGGAGADSLRGGAGNDVYIVGAGDVVTEILNEGNDTVRTDSTFTLGTNLENLILNGTVAINGTGNALDNQITGNSAVNTLIGGAGNDTLDGAGGIDQLTGGTGNDTYIVDVAGDVISESVGEGFDSVKAAFSITLAANLELLYLTGTAAINGTGNTSDNLLYGNAASNTLDGKAGNDILQGSGGADVLSDISGNNLLDGGSGNDTLTGGTSKEIHIGGLGNDTIVTSTGADIIAFNKGDGQDLVSASTGKDNTLSLGGGILYSDLSFKKASNDLILVTGGAEQITFKDWYLSTNNHSVANLQMIITGSTDYIAGSSSAINKSKVVDFNFDGLAGAFDQARATNPTLTAWALSSSLLNFFLSGSDTAAIGGDLAYQYGTNGNLSNISLTPAVAILSSGTFGSAAQALQSSTALQDPTPRLA